MLAGGIKGRLRLKLKGTTYIVKILNIQADSDITTIRTVQTCNVLDINIVTGLYSNKCLAVLQINGLL